MDNNGLQISGDVTKVMDMRPIDQKFASFGWAVTKIDGNDMEQILDTLDKIPLQAGKPTMILCDTVKAKGLSFGENQAGFHFWNATQDKLEQAEKEMDEEIEKLTAKWEGLAE